MRIVGGKAHLSATDLANHLGCRHVTGLDLAAAQGEVVPPTWRDPKVEVLKQRGFDHEGQYLAHLRRAGLSVVEVAGEGSGFEATVAAMRAGAEVIVQAPLVSGDWFGRADILRRVEVASALGEWSYEVVDTKLARETRAGTILQLCLYSHVVGEVQARLPQWMHVVAPGTGFAPQSFRTRDYLAYYRLVQGRLARAVGNAASAADATYPEPVLHCDVCRWWALCDRRRRQDDHLSLVAGVSRLQRRELATWGVATLADLARLPLPLERRPSRGAAEGYVRVREQARVQLEGRHTGAPVYELLPREPGRGLARLPVPSAGDIFFDLEGDPFVGTGGLEYVWGQVVLGAGGAPEYRARWAMSVAQERAAFEGFIDEVMDRWSRDPDLHIYHFAPYEPGAIKRLMGRYASREDEVDRMLRAGLLVDLYAIARQAVRASVERYSIKDLEQFYGYRRTLDLRDASKNLRALERGLELGRVDQVPGEARAAVEAYNRDDCVSTLRLRDWLEGLRAELARAGEELGRPALGDGAPSSAIDERQKRVLALREKLLAGVPGDRETRSDEEQARWLLAHLLDWHRREEKVSAWEYFRLAELSEEELLDERAGLAGLELVGRVGGTGRCPVDRYRFAEQDTDIAEEDDLYKVGGDRLGSVASLDAAARTIDIKKRRDAAEVHPPAVFARADVTAKPLAEALLRLGEWVLAHGVDAPGPYRAARDLLLGRGPRLRAIRAAGAPLVEAGESTVAAARRLGRELDGGVLAIQGPPGAGKTYTGARMICELARTGKKVGITAVSHKVIRHLLDCVVAAATAEGITVRCIQKVKDKPLEDASQPIRETTDNQDVARTLADGTAQVAGGTAWLWARQELFESVDALFVDEAGQMSLANVLAVAQVAKNVVLIGDPQQLEQPQRASHPEGTEVSALQHVLGTKQTIPLHRGLFLAETWRLHPSICALTSELFYEGRLASRSNFGRQALVGAGVFTGAGLWYVPVDHEGNQNSSIEEVERVAEIHAMLLSGTTRWMDSSGETKPLGRGDVLIVAPYNAQVGALAKRLPGARIGTVDKFQGQEAPVVIYSMATSSPEEAPRGMDFLFSANRLNVATSRARCACILVASPRLFEPECRTPRQVQLANAFCRYLELARTV